MYIRDIRGNLVNLADKDIEILSCRPFGDYDAEVRAMGPVGGWWQAEETDIRAQYTLHCGTLAECRDFLGVLASKLGPVIDILGTSTPRPQEPESQPGKVTVCEHHHSATVGLLRPPMTRKLFEYEDLNTGPYIRFGGSQLFLYRRCWWGNWKSFSFDADGAFAICTPWFMWYPWW